ncbi:MAG: hypothetical protein IT463_14370 [Planctomycetes bacterium]|nr:hypothetical protein [Planctomycetota bacterium]
MPKAITEVIIECRTPGGLSLRMERWVYDELRAALLAVLQPGGERTLKQLHDDVEARISGSTRAGLESMSWALAWVRLDLESEGVLSRRGDTVRRPQ